MAEQNKKIVSVEVLHLDEHGYGPEGKHTRREWRDECIRPFLAGEIFFSVWQDSLKENEHLEVKGYRLAITYDDGSLSTHDERKSGVVLDFSGCTFNNLILKKGYTFKYPVTFDYCNFNNEVMFLNNTFEKDASFQHAIFKDKTWFRENHFQNLSLFMNAEFESKVWFIFSSFDKGAAFINTFFKDLTDFSNVGFGNLVFFQEAIFEKIPTFRGCKIDSTHLEFSGESFFPKNDISEEAIRNISFLKRLSDEHGQKDQALHFNAMELRAKRKFLCESLKPQSHQDAELLESHMSWRVWVRFSNLFRDDFWFCVFTWFYEKFSDFGRSFMRPLVLLLCLMVISYIFGIFSAIKHSPAKVTQTHQAIFTELATEYPFENEGDIIPLSAYRAATEYSLYRSGNFLNFTDNDNNTKSVNMRLFGQPIEPCWARLFGFVKGILTAVLLFLTALGLRNKYRVG